MNQRDLNLAVARATGETVCTVTERGFSPAWDEPLSLDVNDDSEYDTGSLLEEPAAAVA